MAKSAPNLHSHSCSSSSTFRTSSTWIVSPSLSSDSPLILITSSSFTSTPSLFSPRALSTTGGILKSSMTSSRFSAAAFLPSPAASSWCLLWPSMSLMVWPVSCLRCCSPPLLLLLYVVAGLKWGEFWSRRGL